MTLQQKPLQENSVSPFIQRLNDQIAKEESKLMQKKRTLDYYKSDYMVIRTKREILHIETKLQSLKFKKKIKTAE